jgi:O-acetyl-ADP-ribose deacetylase (regulator of RNase III)
MTQPLQDIRHFCDISDIALTSITGANFGTIGRSAGAFAFGRLSCCCSDLRIIIGTPSTWDELMVIEFGAGTAVAKLLAQRSCNPLTSGMSLFGAALEWQRHLTKCLCIARGDIGRPPHINGRGSDCILCSTHPALEDNGIPNGAWSVHRHAGDELSQWIATNVVDPAEVMRKELRDAGKEVDDLVGYVRFGDVRVCPAGELRSYHYAEDGSLTPVDGDEGQIRNVIFGVGPAPTRHGRMAVQYCKQIVASVLRRTFEEMDNHGLSTIVMASIGTGFGGTPLEASAEIAMKQTATWLSLRYCCARNNESDCELATEGVIALCYEQEAYDAFVVAKDEAIAKCLVFLQDPDAPKAVNTLPPNPDVQKEDGVDLAGEPTGTPAHCRQS